MNEQPDKNTNLVRPFKTGSLINEAHRMALSQAWVYIEWAGISVATGYTNLASMVTIEGETEKWCSMIKLFTENLQWQGKVEYIK